MSLTLVEARARAALISDVSYALELDLTGAAEEQTFGVRAEVTFSCAQPGAETFLELTHASDLLVDGVAAEYDGQRIRLTDLRERQTVVVEALMPYVTDGEGMHHFRDPADGEVYASAYLGMDVARNVFPCFDQNDLKAPVALQVTAPEHWTVVSNSRVSSRDGGRWGFATTPPLPVAMFVICGGPWASVTWEHAGVPFGWHARASLRSQLERDAAELRQLTVDCFDHYAQVFEVPFPFDSYDQVMAPGQNWGALESPGCVTYRDEFLPLGDPTQPERRARAMVIAHEMSHMWFGDLVTMTWWEDTWLQESFADYLGFRVSEAAGVRDPFVDFTVARKPVAYAADARRSSHPVAPTAEEVPDLDAATGNFDALSYAKGGSCLRQLVTWIGEDAFYAGVNAYLSRHAWGNTTLADFVAALDDATDRDVRSWVEAWLRTTGFDTITVTRDGDEVVLTREGSRPHRLRVTSYDADWREVSSTLVDLADEPVRLPGATVVVPNAGGETFARVRLDDQSWAAVEAGLSRVPDDLARALLWSVATDRAGVGDLALDDLLALVRDHLPVERHPAIVTAVLRWVGIVLPLVAPADRVTDALVDTAATCAAALDTAPAPDLAVVWTRQLAAADTDHERLRAWAARSDDPALRWIALHRLASLDALDSDAIERERLADGTVVGDLGAGRALAAIPDAAAKAAAWARMTEDPHISNRLFEAMAEGFWDVEQAELVAPYVARYWAEAPRIGAARGPSFCARLGNAFPWVPLTDEQVGDLETALAGDVPAILRRDWEDALDDLRAVQKT